MKHLIKQTTLLTISNVITRVISMMFFVILARSLDVSDYGLFRYLFTIASMYAIIFAGIPTALTRFIGEARGENKSVNSYLVNSVFLYLFLFVLLTPVVIIINSNSVYILLFLFALFVDSIYLGYVRGLLNLFKLSSYKLISNIIILLIMLIIFLIFRQVNFTYSILIYSFAGVLSVILFESIWPQISLNGHLSFGVLTRLLKYMVPVTLGAIGWTVMFGVNSIFIEHFYSTTDVGYYSVGLTLVQIFSFLPDAVATLIMPKIASLEDLSRINRPLGLAIFVCLGSSLVILLPLLLYKDFILKYLFTEKYIPALAIILPLSIGQILIATHQIFASVWQGLNKPAIPSVTISIAAVLNIAGSYFLTKSHGIWGASISLMLTSLIAMLAMLFTWWKWGLKKERIAGSAIAEETP